MTRTTPMFRVAIQTAMILLSVSMGFAKPIENDPSGFYGIKWGDPVATLPGLVKLDTEGDVEVYSLENPSPTIGGIPVDSVKFTTIEGKLAQVAIRYHGEDTHRSLLRYLEAQYGTIELPPGSMMRGLSQQYSWRGKETEISITYRGFRQQGYLFAESRRLAPWLMDAISDESF